MDNVTVRWISNLLVCIGTGLLVTEMTTGALGDMTRTLIVAQTIGLMLSGTLIVGSSYLVAIWEKE